MKKLITVMLALTMVFSLCACEGADSLKSIELPPLPTDTPAPEPTATAAAEPTATPAPAVGQIIVSTTKTEKQGYDPKDGTKLILSFSYETPAVYIEGNPDASSAINDRVSKMEETYYTGEDYGEGSATGYNNMLTMAEDNFNYLYNEGIEDGMYELASSRTVTVARADQQALTLLYHDYCFTGGAHGVYGDLGCSFDATTGELLTLDSLSSDPEALKAALLAAMVETATTDVNINERIDQTLVADGDYEALLEPLLRDGSWYLGRDGVVIFSSLYEISSYAAGPIEFRIPYEELESVIDDKWIPAPVDGSGSFAIVGADAMVDGSTEILDKVTVSTAGGEFYLVAQGKVQNVRLSVVDYTDSFFETAQLWNCSEMEDAALQVAADIPDGMPNLMITWSTTQGDNRMLVTQSGEDGSYILVDDTIEAVG